MALDETVSKYRNHTHGICGRKERKAGGGEKKTVGTDGSRVIILLSEISSFSDTPFPKAPLHRLNRGGTFVAHL